MQFTSTEPRLKNTAVYSVMPDKVIFLVSMITSITFWHNQPRKQKAMKSLYDQFK